MKKKMCEQGTQTGLCPLSGLLFVKESAAGGPWGGGVRGEKVLQLNYIVCGEQTGADRQMADDKCCWGAGQGWVERFRSVLTALKGQRTL